MEKAWLNYKDMVTQAVILAVPDYDGMMSGRSGCFDEVSIRFGTIERMMQTRQPAH